MSAIVVMLGDALRADWVHEKQRWHAWVEYAPGRAARRAQRAERKLRRTGKARRGW